MSVLLLLFFRKVLPPACHLERSPPEIPPSLYSVLLHSSTPLRFAQNDTGGRSRNPKGERQRRSDLAGRLKTALWKVPLGKPFFNAERYLQPLFISRENIRHLICARNTKSVATKSKAIHIKTVCQRGSLSKAYVIP